MNPLKFFRRLIAQDTLPSIPVRGASGILYDNISIAPLPLKTIPKSANITGIEHPMPLYAYNCTPDGAYFSPG